MDALAAYSSDSDDVPVEVALIPRQVRSKRLHNVDKEEASEEAVELGKLHTQLNTPAGATGTATGKAKATANTVRANSREPSPPSKRQKVVAVDQRNRSDN